MENEIKVEAEEKVTNENNTDKENFSGNKSDDSLSQRSNGSESSTKVGGIRLVSLSTLIDKPKAWVKEALMEPEIIELNSDDDDSDDVQEITECTSGKDSKNSKIKSENSLETKSKRTDTLSERFKSKFSVLRDSLEKRGHKGKKNVQIVDENVDYDNFTSCRVVLEKVAKLEDKLKSNSSSKKNSSSSEDEELPLSKLKKGKRPKKKSGKKSTSDAKQSSSDSDSTSSASESNEKSKNTAIRTKTRKTRNTKSINSEEKSESEKNDSASEVQEKKSLKVKKSGTKKTVGFDLGSEINSKIKNLMESETEIKSKNLRSKKSTDSENENPLLVDSEAIKAKIETEFQENKPSKGRKLRSKNQSLDSESDISKNSDESESKKDTEKSKKIDSKSDMDEKKNTKGKKTQKKESIDSESEKNSDESESKTESKTESETDGKSNGITNESEKNKSKNSRRKKTSEENNEETINEKNQEKMENQEETKEINENSTKNNGNKSKKNNSRKKKSLESESEEETLEENNQEETEEVIENTVTKNNGNDLKITIKRNKTVVARKRVISSESESEKPKEDTKKDSENEETVEPDEESDKPATVATNKKKRTRVVTSDESDKDFKQPESESEEDDKKKSSKTVEPDEESDKPATNKKKRTRVVTSDESDKDFYPTKSKLPEEGASSNSSESEEDAKKNKSEDDKEKKKVRRRIKTADNSNDSSSDNELNDSKGQRRKKIRKLLGKDELSSKTKSATKEEMERRKRIADRQKMYNEICKNHLLEKSKLDKVVLDFDPDEKKDLVSVHPKLVSTLKPHQANGIKFMWDCCFESLEHSKESKGSGCILAHCMGLGKTLQVVTLIHTLLTHEETNIKTVMVVCPLSTVLNWVNEFNIWLSKINGGNDVDVYEITKFKKMVDRSYKIKEWHDNGGVLVIGYEMFRNLSCTTNKRIRKPVLNRLQTGLINPGPDLVVCDEGHLLKNEKARISVAMNKIATLRRIVLTGTPLQNNLKEYYCMIQFVKPNLLGTYKEYTNRFVNPIVNGQYIDSTPHDIEIMKRRSHVLHKLLDGVVQRRDYSVLAPFLPPKQEYVLYLTLHPLQEKLYEIYIQNYSKRSQSLTGGKAVALFSDFQELSRIWTHPRSLRFYSDKCERDRAKQMTDSDEINSFICDDESDTTSTPDSSSEDSDFNPKKKKPKKRRITRAKAKQMESDVESSPEEADKNDGSDSDCKIIEEKKEEFNSDWWVKHVDDAVLEDITYSSKLLLFFKILKKCEEIGDKVLVFSQSLFSLDLIEYFLDKLDYASHNKSEQQGWLSEYSSSWDLGLDYFRLDGSSSVDNRATWCKSFNDVTNIRARLFLISTKAGGLGINLVAANRVIIFDVSWNPSHDIQSIFRVYRFGQTKPCYIYRFIAMGTMEEKVYERQVTKLAISKRVIDEHQIDRHYNQNDLNEIYKFTPMSGEEKPIPMVPKDRLLAETLQELSKQIFKYHEHDSLLEHKEDEELDEEERKAAWDEFENEKQQKPPPMMNYYPQYNIANNFNNQFQIEIQNTSRALEVMLRQRNPTWTDLQIQQSIPILLQQVYQFGPGGFQHSAFPQPQFGMAQPRPAFPQPNTSMMQQ
ncbi:transcriptional regulator ATRX homolog [Chrysoperla carnea]|uniref:transcriptional regulator ATRX homolog n=1 Tax=Chrysoperla carnea TaxID=189513 RepID=UPI001D063794|nr:transcriptional regulator ATRX homolog [Chrysoperla carnea]